MADIKTAISIEDKLSPALGRMISTMNKTITTMSKLDKASKGVFEETIDNTIKATNKMKDFQRILDHINDSSIEEVADTLDEVANKGEKAGKSVNNNFFKNLLKQSSQVAGAIYTLKQFGNAIEGVIKTSDRLTLMNARLGLISDNVDIAKSKIKSMALESRSSYMDMADSVSQIGILAGDAFNNNEDEIIKFMGTMNKMFKISGASAEAQSSAMYNLVQSLGAGTLIGQDYRYIRQNAPLFQKALQEYYGVGVDELKKMVELNKVSAKDMKKALFMYADTVNEKFESIPKTFADSMNELKTNFFYSLDGLNEKLNEFINTNAFSSFLAGIEDTFNAIFTYVDTFLNILSTITSFASQFEGLNRLVETLAYAVGVSLPLAFIYFGAVATAALLKPVIELIIAQWKVMLIILAIGLLLGIVHQLGATFRDVLGSIIFVLELIVGSVIALGQIFAKVLFEIAKLIMDSLVRPLKGVLLLIDGIAKCLDKVFNTNFSSFTGRAVNALAKIQEKVGEVTDVGEITNPLEWAKTGMNNFYGIYDKFTNKVGDVSKQLKSLGSTDDLGEIENLLSSGVPVDGVKGTVNTKGEVDISDEDLKLLKDISATEFINRYTTLRPVLNASFGDIRETANVDAILDRVGELMENALSESLA